MLKRWYAPAQNEYKLTKWPVVESLYELTKEPRPALIQASSQGRRQAVDQLEFMVSACDIFEKAWMNKVFTWKQLVQL